MRATYVSRASAARIVASSFFSAPTFGLQSVLGGLRSPLGSSATALVRWPPKGRQAARPLACDLGWPGATDARVNQDRRDRILEA